jgi:hypothetical protein
MEQLGNSAHQWAMIALTIVLAGSTMACTTIAWQRVAVAREANALQQRALSSMTPPTTAAAAPASTTTGKAASKPHK